MTAIVVIFYHYHVNRYAADLNEKHSLKNCKKQLFDKSNLQKTNGFGACYPVKAYVHFSESSDPGGLNLRIGS